MDCEYGTMAGTSGGSCANSSSVRKLLTRHFCNTMNFALLIFIN